jgi:hypothetical protein
MTPSRLSAELRRIASMADSASPSRSAVSSALRRALAAVAAAPSRRTVYDSGVEAPNLEYLLKNLGVVDQFGQRTDLNEEELEKLSELEQLWLTAVRYFSGKGHYSQFMSYGGKDWPKKELSKHLEGEVAGILRSAERRHREAITESNRSNYTGPVKFKG